MESTSATSSSHILTTPSSPAVSSVFRSGFIRIARIFLRRSCPTTATVSESLSSWPFIGGHHRMGADGTAAGAPSVARLRFGHRLVALPHRDSSVLASGQQLASREEHSMEDILLRRRPERAALRGQLVLGLVECPERDLANDQRASGHTKVNTRRSGPAKGAAGSRRAASGVSAGLHTRAWSRR